MSESARDPHAAGSSAPAAGGSRALSWWWLAVLLAAVLPSLGSFDAGLISDDGAALGWVHRHGLFADWTSSEYGLGTVRFWRPLVTSTLALQERISGVAPEPLRAFNLACHAAAALLAALLALRLGGGRVGALCGGLLAACVPVQGGVVTWIVGRVDAQCAPLLLAGVLCALDGRWLLAAAASFLALATKEMAFATPLVAMLLGLGRGDGWRRAALRSWPCWLALALALVWRRLALGAWIGGYPSPALGFEGLALAALGFARASWPLLLGGVAFLGPLLFARAGGRAPLRAWAACALAAAGCAGLLVHVLASGRAAPEHLRTLYVPLLLLAIGAGASFGALWSAQPARAPRALAAALALALLGALGWRAREDVRVWAEAGRSAERWVAKQLAGVDPAADPAALGVLAAFEAPRLDASARAYVLHWGVADRFRPPFREPGLCIWPWRAVFEGAQTARDFWGERIDAGAAHALALPDLRSVSPLPVLEQQRLPSLGADAALFGLEAQLFDRGARVDELVLDARLWDEAAARGPDAQRIELVPREAVRPADGAGAVEAILFTELGYQAALCPAFLSGARPAAASLRDVMLSSVGSGGLYLWQVWELAADVGATEARLKLRWLESAAPGASELASSAWLRLSWPAALRERVQPR